MRNPFIHLGGNLYASIDVETTGTVPHHNDIIQVAIIPLGYDLRPSKDRLPFLMDIVPKRPENIDQEAMRINRLKLCDIMVRGIEAYRAADLLVEWFFKQELGYNRRITPIGANYVFDRDFLIEWLGRETYNMIFSSDFRDVQHIAKFRNDRDCWNSVQVSHDQTALKDLCRVFKIERTRAHDATDDARVTAEVYRSLVQEYI